MNDAVEAFNLFVIPWLPVTFMIFQRDEQYAHIYINFILESNMAEIITYADFENYFLKTENI